MNCTWPKRIEHDAPSAPHALAGCSCRGARVGAPAAGRSERIRSGERLAACGSVTGGAAARRRVLVHLARGDVLSLDDLAAAQQSRNRDARARTAPESRRRQMTAGHFIFIPSVLLIGVIVGWLLGSRAARDAYA